MFKNDLELGQKFEDYILGKIKKKYPKAYRIEGENKDGDIYIPEIKEMVECKFDRMAHKTGNIALEVEYKGNPSGIVTSKSKWWAVGIYEKYAIIPKEELLIFSCLYDKISAGDNNYSTIILAPIDDWYYSFSFRAYG
jgi:hypothetical protein